MNITKIDIFFGDTAKYPLSIEPPYQLAHYIYDELKSALEDYEQRIIEDIEEESEKLYKLKDKWGNEDGFE